ncbi:MAG: hypothetical protein Q9169_005960 [Polycauliona sp. 2 TL-2023]
MSVASRYGLHISAILFVFTLFLLLSTRRGVIDSPTATKRSSPNLHHLPIESVPLLDVSAIGVKSIALPFGRQGLTLNLSSSPLDSVLSKRAPPKEPLAWPTLVCTGGKFLEKIQAAFESSSPSGREYTSADLDNGWTSVPLLPGVVPDTSLDKYWSSVFTEAKDKQLDIKSINVKQDKKYTTNAGTEITNPTKAYSISLSIPSLHFLNSLNSLSPVAVITRRTPSISKSDRDAQLPPLSRLSDILWLNWISTSPTPRSLRYIGISKISNRQSGSAMDYLFNRDAGGKNPQKEDIAWPGLEYSGDSDELKALLATPNGIAVAWMLIDHAEGLRGKGDGLGLVRRELKVNIFEVGRDYFILWDIEAQSPRDI